MIRCRRAPLLAVSAVALFSGLAWGQTENDAPKSEPPPDAATTTRPLSLADAVAIGIQNNLDVQVERHAPLIAREDLGVAWGAFDPVFNLEGGASDTETPNSNPFNASAAISDRIYDTDAGIEGLIPWLGGSYSAGYTASEQKTESSLSTLSPQFDSRLAVQLEVPLLKNLIWSEPWTAVRRSRISVAEGDQEFRTRLMDVVKGIEDAYWALIATKENLRVAEKSLETAKALEAQTRVQYEVGVVSQVEVTEAEAGVAEREVSRIRAESEYENAHDALVNQVLGARFTPVFDLRIDPTDSPDQIGIREIDVADATEVAFELRPELAVLRKALEREELNLRFARNQRLPEFNVQGSIGFAGLGGRENPNRFVTPSDPTDPNPPPQRGQLPTPNPDFGDAHDDLFTASGAKQWAVRGVISIPFGNVSERHSYRRARFQLDRAESRLRRERQVVIVEIRRAVRELKAALEGIEAAERRRLAAAEQLRAERLRLEYGESTPFDVLEREQDLVEAEEQKIVSEQIYHNSVSGLTRAQGTTLRNRNIAIEDVIPGPLDQVLGP